MKPEARTAVRKRVVRLTNALRLRIARIPYYRQIDANDCGVACLRMTLEFHGRRVRYKDLHCGVQTRADGVTAAALVRSAEVFGLRAAAIHATRETLPSISRGTILHCRSGHYVVLDGVERDGTIRVMDPLVGRRTIPAADYGVLLSGIAIVFQLADDDLNSQVVRSSAAQMAQRAWSRYRHVLPGALFWTAAHVISLGAAAALIGILGSRLEPSIAPPLIGCAALVFCEASRTTSIRRQCARARFRTTRDELRALLQRPDIDAGEQLAADSGSLIKRTLTSHAEIVEQMINLGHQATCVCGAFVVLLFVNPVAWLNVLVVGVAFATNATRAAVQRVDMDAEAPALEAMKSRAVAGLLRTLGPSKAAIGDQELEHRCTTVAGAYEQTYSKFERWNSQSDAMSRLWILATAITAIWSIGSDVQSEASWAPAAAFFVLLLSVSTTLSAQRVISATVRLIALENELEYYEGTIYVLSNKANRLKSVG